MKKTTFGLIGLGVMGKSISLNIAEKGFDISVFNRTEAGEENIVTNFIQENNNFQNITGFTDLAAFVASIESPRKILIMIKAGSALDMVIEKLQPLLEPNDVIIDGGNSHFEDTLKRTTYLAAKQIHFVGCGISGGEEGARKGPSMMPGGSKEAYQNLAPILEKIVAKDKNGNPCCSYIGTDGAGHFVKMVHNGIEYAEMQLLAEVYSVLAVGYNHNEIAAIFTEWNKGDLASYLLEITANIFRKKEGSNYLIDTILDKAGSKGTGCWSSKTALDLGAPNTMMASAVFARYVSALKDKRTQLSKTIQANSNTEKIDIKSLENAYRLGRIINHQQGFELMQQASIEYNWNLNLSEIARIWTNGCIIRSDFMEQSAAVFKTQTNYFDNKNIFDKLVSIENDTAKTLAFGLQNRIALDTLSAALSYWFAMTTQNLPANLIQAQRDYFGAHTYQRKDTDSSEFFHTNWL